MPSHSSIEGAQIRRHDVPSDSRIPSDMVALRQPDQKASIIRVPSREKCIGIWLEIRKLEDVPHLRD